MRKVMVLVCGALVALSAPVFAQTAGPQTPNVSQPTGSSVVNYQNGLQALGQASRDENNQNNGPQIDPTTGLIVGGLVVGGGIIGAIALTRHNSSQSVSP